MRRACRECGAEFEAKRKNAYFCCRRCGMLFYRRAYRKSHPEPKRPPPCPRFRFCRWCGTPFIPKRSDAQSCSQGCNYASWKVRNLEHDRDRRRQCYQRNLDKSREKARRDARKSYQRSPEKWRQRHRAWRAANPDKAKHSYTEYRRQQARERYEAEFHRLQSILAEKLEMAAIIEAKNNLIAELRTLSTEDLRQQLIDRLGLTAESLLRTACLVAVLEERGEDLSGLKIGLLNHLRKMAAGKLLPEIVVQFAGNGKLINRISELAIADQRRILAGADPKEVLRLEAPAPRHSPAPHNEKPNLHQKEEDAELFAQRPEAVIPAGSPRDVAEYLFRLVVKHDQPGAVMGHLRDFFAEWEAGGKRGRIVLEDIA
jgi:hypothetical protein